MSGGQEQAVQARQTAPEDKNVLGEDLKLCCRAPVTGFYRDGFCKTGPQDVGRHVVCAQVTAEWLNFSKARGNDLITPMPMYNFPGLKPGDKWCLCASRWLEAYQAGCAPPVCLDGTHQNVLKYGITLKMLQEHALPAASEN